MIEVFDLVGGFLNRLLVFLVVEVSAVGGDDRQLATATAHLRECELQIVESFLGLGTGKLEFVREVV